MCGGRSLRVTPACCAATAPDSCRFTFRRSSARRHRHLATVLGRPERYSRRSPLLSVIGPAVSVRRRALAATSCDARDGSIAAEASIRRLVVIGVASEQWRCEALSGHSRAGKRRSSVHSPSGGTLF